MNNQSENFYETSENFPIGIFSQSIYFEEPHHHIEYEIFYLQKGEATLIIDTLELSITAGTVVFINPETTHSISKKENCGEFHYYAIVFDNSVIGQPGDSIRSIFDSIRVSRTISLPENILNQIVQAAEIEKKLIFGKELYIKTLLYEILSYIIQTKQYIEITNKRKITTNHSINAIDVSIKYITEHYRELITMDDLLKITNYSKSHFIRLFKKYTGMNLTDYINKYRIEKSCLDLLYTNKNITEIAMENGFNTVQYFSKIFKLYMNCTPKKYQKEGRNIMIPSSVANII